MMFRDILVLLADPRLPDLSKPGGRFTDDDFDQVKRLRAALTTLTGRNFVYLDDHRDLYASLRDAAPRFALCPISTRWLPNTEEPIIITKRRWLGCETSSRSRPGTRSITEVSCRSRPGWDACCSG